MSFTSWYKEHRILLRQRFRISIHPVVILAIALPVLFSLDGRETNAVPAKQQSVLVGTQYDTTHVYVPADKLEAFTASFVATFGGEATKPAIMNVLPVPSSTQFQAVRTPVGNLSIFAFQTPIPFPFGQERNGYLVTDMDRAVEAAKKAGAEVIVAPFQDPIGRDAVIQWPGGLKMQFYWHFKTPAPAPPLQTVPESRVYLSPDAASAFLLDLVKFDSPKQITDEPSADAGEIGRPGETYRRIRLIDSGFGKMTIFVTDGHLPYPFGYDTTGYQVADLNDTLAKAKAAGAIVLSPAYDAGDRSTAIVQFPGGYIAEIHRLKH